jgi:hypothetical protein
MPHHSNRVGLDRGGGVPDCADCGCMASAGLAAVGRYRVGGVLPVDMLLSGSLRIGRTIAAARSSAA